ncbi:hypothetical protein DF141_18055 [Burkholderia cenocepacia]|uniref:hypothetical protein n=1 Tax=Burkholderia TaxID=32008 RepID=UPI000F58FAF6|nr:hypothetical protein [Burkholderia sp. LAS2]MBP0715730.1 hypothetical protein [Burkholderia sp. AcTa6-5]RQU73268.1 hypothetical protein DF141_18055 [Burkholderia cenocepacia]QVN14929.1 hypothetical protein JYG37_22840 [Burkholderia sp. LAS2]RQV14423.1 hypothetical protein DF132_30485 [Burkholderia cenocepacia]RQV59003.1 hypothetical protein DF018_31115 [Burkholderia cenocepacia]
MAECNHCGRTFLVGGRSIDGRRYCSPACARAHPVVVEAERVPDAKVRQYVDDWRYGPCPICLREGRPVDVHASHRVVSLVFVTRWATRRHVCCRRCGRRKQAVALLASATLGWWGLPWGIVLTPIQLARNVLGLAARDPEAATPQFEALVRRKLAARRLARAERGAGA